MDTFIYLCGITKGKRYTKKSKRALLYAYLYRPTV